MQMPKADNSIIERRNEIADGLRTIIPSHCVIDNEASMKAYDADGLSAYRQMPLVVVLPETTQQVADVMKWCRDQNIKIVPRGAGTSLSGGALPLADGVLLGLGKFNQILDIDYENRCVVTQPGVTNLGITHAVEDNGFYYAPDPSSQIACSIGGNFAATFYDAVISFWHLHERHPMRNLTIKSHLITSVKRSFRQAIGAKMEMLFTL